MMLKIALKQVLNWRKLPSDYAMRFSKFDLLSENGDPIKGWHIPGEKNVAILIVPGFRTTKGLYLGLAQAYHQLGYPVTLFDARGQGESKGSTEFSFGYYEVEDVQKIIHAFPGKYALLGFSCGAAAALIASLEMPDRVVTTIADSGLVSLGRIKHRKRESPIQTLLKNRLIAVIENTQHKIPYLSDRLNLEERCRELKNVFFIHGKEDATIRWTNSEFMYNRARELKRLWIPRHVGHCETVVKHSQQYLEDTAEFIEQCLKEG